MTAWGECSFCLKFSSVPLGLAPLPTFFSEMLLPFAVVKPPIHDTVLLPSWLALQLHASELLQFSDGSLQASVLTFLIPSFSLPEIINKKITS